MNSSLRVKDRTSPLDRSNAVIPTPKTLGPASLTPAACDHGRRDVADLNEPAAKMSDSDVALCKLSLTRDDAKHPRPSKGPFGHDFEPFM